jgi:hypothetical protein
LAAELRQFLHVLRDYENTVHKKIYKKERLNPKTKLLGEIKLW